MRAFARHGLVRGVAVFLLLWIGLDLGLPETTTVDILDAAAAATGVWHNDVHGASSNGLLHPDHCFNHGQAFTLASHAPVERPADGPSVFPPGGDMLPSGPARALDHPPQLAA
jgi:hypothetical protein